ncbi:MAG TPA: hypothetical protein VGC89_22765, partial [Pyrinomonadaceae bacterium]
SVEPFIQRQRYTTPNATSNDALLAVRYLSARGRGRGVRAGKGARSMSKFCESKESRYMMKAR